MKIVAITANTSWYLYNFRKNTILALIDAGYKVVVISPRDDYTAKLENLGIEYEPIVIDQRGTNPLKDILTFLCFIKLYKKIRPDVVLNFTPKNNIYSTFASSFVKTKVINNIAGLGMLFISESFISKVARVLYKVSQKKANIIFFQNNDDREIFKKFRLAPMELTSHMPGSGVDLSRFTIAPSNDDGVIRFLLVARMLYDKGIKHYAEAAQILRSIYGDKVEFRLLGFVETDNPSAVSPQEIQTWVNEGVINYLGVSDSVEKEIALADCVVLPSYYREGVPKSLLEACAMGKPIVTTDSVGCRETVDDGINGYLCKPRNTASLVDKLEAIISLTHTERLIMGQKSRTKAEGEFDERIVITRYLSAIESVIGIS